MIRILKKVESGQFVREVGREYRISASLTTIGRFKYGEMKAADIKLHKERDKENRRLKHMDAASRLDHKILKDCVEKKR